MKIIIDTNIVFSAILNSKGLIGDLLFNSDDFFEYYSCSYMRQEIDKHWDKLKRISKLSDDKLNESSFQVFGKISFINENLIPGETWIAAEKIATGIDLDDTDFIALTRHLKGFLWTGDKELYSGLKKKNFRRVLNTAEMAAIRKAKS